MEEKRCSSVLNLKNFKKREDEKWKLEERKIFQIDRTALAPAPFFRLTRLSSSGERFLARTLLQSQSSGVSDLRVLTGYDPFPNPAALGSSCNLRQHVCLSY